MRVMIVDDSDSMRLAIERTLRRGPAEGIGARCLIAEPSTRESFSSALQPVIGR